MDGIETILGKGSSLKDFTLHDQDHSFRVAERMADIVLPDVLDKLSPFELAFLLFSAYLHDIGMTPEYSKVEQLYAHLGGRPDSGLSAAEVETFQRWMDEEERTFTGDNAAELVTYYCRHKHNDWSGDWTREHINRIYWLKDREVGLKVDSKGVRIEARPSRAILHRAVEVMINDIDHELQVCRNLDAECRSTITAPIRNSSCRIAGTWNHWSSEPFSPKTRTDGLPTITSMGRFDPTQANCSRCWAARNCMARRSPQFASSCRMPLTP